MEQYRAGASTSVHKEGRAGNAGIAGRAQHASLLSHAGHHGGPARNQLQAR